MVLYLFPLMHSHPLLTGQSGSPFIAETSLFFTVTSTPQPPWQARQELLTTLLAIDFASPLYARIEKYLGRILSKVYNPFHR